MVSAAAETISSGKLLLIHQAGILFVQNWVEYLLGPCAQGFASGSPSVVMNLLCSLTSSNSFTFWVQVSGVIPICAALSPEEQHKLFMGLCFSKLKLTVSFIPCTLHNASISWLQSYFLKHIYNCDLAYVEALAQNPNIMQLPYKGGLCTIFPCLCVHWSCLLLLYALLYESSSLTVTETASRGAKGLHLFTLAGNALFKNAPSPTGRSTTCISSQSSKLSQDTYYRITEVPMNGIPQYFTQVIKYKTYQCQCNMNCKACQ